MTHPNYDEFWQKQAFAPYFKDLTLEVPNLNVAGWWDQEDFYGPLKIYELLEKNDTKHMNYLVAGAVESRRLGAVRRTKARATIDFRQQHERVLSREHPGAVVRVLAEGQGCAAGEGSADVSRRAQTGGGATTRGRRERA